MKVRVSFLVSIYTTFALLLALPVLSGTWRTDFEDEAEFEQQKNEGVWE